MKRIIILIAIVFIGLNFLWAQEEVRNMRITSPEFKHNESIPGKFTCEGEDINPELDLPPKKWTQRRVGVSIKAGS